jgi:hypothetical protein
MDTTFKVGIKENSHTYFIIIDSNAVRPNARAENRDDHAPVQCWASSAAYSNDGARILKKA